MRHSSLRRRFLPQLLIILLALIAFLAVYHIGVTSTLRDRSASEGTKLCGIYVAEIDDVLTGLRRWLTVLTEDGWLTQLSGEDGDMRFKAQKLLTAQLQDGLALYPAAAMAFALSDESPDIISATAGSLDFERYQELMEAARAIAGYGREPDTEWSVALAGESCVFFTTLRVENALLGVMVEPETLLGSMPFYDQTDQHFVLAKHNGYIVTTTLPDVYGEGIDLTGDLNGYYMTGERRDIVVCGAQSACGPFRLMMVARDSDIMSGMRWSRWISALLIVVSALSVLAVIWSLKRQVLAPLDKATRAIAVFGRDQTVQLEPGGHEALEFWQIYEAFNTMAGEIRQLKIENYERLLHKQQAELRFYQSQIRPHFILNCLTTIRNLAQQNRQEELEQFIDAFSGFARCMFRTDCAPIRVRDELKQAEYFIALQSVRYPERIFYLADAGEDALEAQLPAMLIQTLVENSVKHGLDEGSQLSVFVKCTLEAGSLTVAVEDSGGGFSPSALEAVNAGQSSGFGLKNLRATLALLYGDRASMVVKNIPGSGASVTVVIPQA